MTAYYNENDPFAAAWLRELVRWGHIADGYVDERSISDVQPSDLAGFKQCHFFAGIGGWSAALRLAGWPDDWPVWTGSCPCQPFSAAGKGAGFADERHLWPDWFWLIEQCRPDVLLGEQVEGPAGRAWIDLVHTDVEGTGYAFGVSVFPAAGIGAPHGRHRTYWMAHADAGNRSKCGVAGIQERSRFPRRLDDDGCGPPCCMALADEGQRGRRAIHVLGKFDRQDGGRTQDHREPAGSSSVVELADARAPRLSVSEPDDLRGARRRLEGRAVEQRDGSLADGLARWPGPVNGDWRDADWLRCRDGKWRPVEAGTFPLAHGIPGRVGRLRGYGNAIVPQQAAPFVAAAIGWLGLEIEREIAA